MRKTLKDFVPKSPARLADKLAVWSEMAGLTVRHKCESLGQGAPDLSPPKFLREEMIKAIDAGHNQYCRSFGHPQLVKKVSEVYGARFDREVDPMKEVLVTQGANGGLSSFINAFINAGDELVTFEPGFPMVYDHVEMAGGKTNALPLVYSNGEWNFDADQLRQALSKPETKMFILNTPHNPTGKVFTVEEMQTISDILDDCPHVMVLSDEVYDFLTFDGRKHNLFASIGNNWDRTVSVYSGGKLLNATGWKVGWCIGPQHLIHMGGIISTSVSYCFNAPGQVGIANSFGPAFAKDLQTYVNPKTGLEEHISYVDYLRELFESNRDYLKTELSSMDIPWEPLECEGGYFFMADISKCKHLIPERYLTTHDYQMPEDGPKVTPYELRMPNGEIPLDLAFCRWMACENGVVMMPNSFFYVPGSPYTSDRFVRLAICKEKANIVGAVERLKQLKF